MIRRETYLPLDTLKTKPINDQLRQVGGTAKLVVDVIKYDPAAIKVNFILYTSHFYAQTFFTVIPHIAATISLHFSRNHLTPSKLAIYRSKCIVGNQDLLRSSNDFQFARRKNLQLCSQLWTNRKSLLARSGPSYPLRLATVKWPFSTG